MAPQSSLRIGDREREAAAAELREHYAQGRLTLGEFNQRIDAVFAAKTQRDLSRVTSDLPHVRPDDVPLPSAQVGRRQQGTASAVQPGWAGLDERARYRQREDWRQGPRRSPGGFAAVLATLLAALATWLLVYDVVLVGLRVPLVGRLGLLVAIFTVLRGLLRRIFGSRRGVRCGGRGGRGGRRR